MSRGLAVAVALSLMLAGAPALAQSNIPDSRLPWWIAEYKQKAEAGDADAMFHYGKAHFDGLGIAANHEEGVRWLLRSADLGDRNAMFYMGVAHLEGRGVARDPQKAFMWHYKAAVAGEPTAMLNTAIVLLKGGPVEASPVNGAMWLIKAAEAGEPTALVLAAHLTLDDTGSYFPGGPRKALDWALKAKAAKADGAAAAIGEICDKGYKPACAHR